MARGNPRHMIRFFKWDDEVTLQAEGLGPLWKIERTIIKYPYFKHTIIFPRF